MTEKIILGAVGVFVIVIAVIMTPDLIRYMKIRSM
jgi:hypothetical protein